MIYTKNNCLYRRSDKELLCIEPYGKNAFRIRATHLGQIKDNPLSALINKPTINDKDVSIQINDDSAVITNGIFKIEVLCTGKLKYYKNNRLILEDYDKNRFRKNAPGETDSALEIIPRTFRPILGTDNFKLTVRFEAKDSENFYGMGIYSNDFFNLKGCSLELSQRNSQVSIPFVISSEGYGFFWNHPGVGSVNFSRNITAWEAQSIEVMDYWICADETVKDIVQQYTRYTGLAPVIPDYALGFWQSKLRYRSQEEVLSVAKRYKELNLPLSIIVIDFFHWTAQGDYRFDPKLWPNPKQMVKELKEMGIEVMVSVWPTIEEKSINLAYMEEHGLLIRTEAASRFNVKNKETYIDATNPETREFVWSQLKKNYYDQGIKLFWLDECEPELQKYEYDHYRFHVGASLKAGNVYPKEFTRMVYEGRKAEGEEEIISLARCGWAGSQHYGSLIWTGDVSSDFNSLRSQVSAGMSMGLCGISWWTSDIGGFHGANINDEKYKECFIRWFQFGAFSPVFRLHGFRLPTIVSEGGFEFTFGNGQGWYYTSGSPNEVWSYGETVFNICKKYLFIREKIRPYLKEQMIKYAKEGTPVMRPLFFDYENDPITWTLNNQYLLGPNLLVAPILEAQATKRNVYLPKGKWFDINHQTYIDGEQFIETNANLDEIPVFVKNDTIEYLFKE